MRFLMDADCLIKLTKSKLKELVCTNFTIVIPQVVKEETVDNAQGFPDAAVIEKNIEKKLIALDRLPASSRQGEESVFTVFQEGNYDAVCSDDKRFIKRLRLFEIPYLTPSVFVVILLREGKLTVKEAKEKLDSLSPFVSDEEYNAVRMVVENWRDQ
jgi:rRNA-processing protein FCF1